MHNKSLSKNQCQPARYEWSRSRNLKKPQKHNFSNLKEKFPFPLQYLRFFLLLLLPVLLLFFLKLKSRLNKITSTLTRTAGLFKAYNKFLKILCATLTPRTGVGTRGHSWNWTKTGLTPQLCPKHLLPENTTKQKVKAKIFKKIFHSHWISWDCPFTAVFK